TRLTLGVETNRIRRFVLPYFRPSVVWRYVPESGLFRDPGLLAHLKVRQRRIVFGPGMTNQYKQESGSADKASDGLPACRND
ncbi:MAG: hypothetical protein K8R59_01325, partial [Thermoanaerobaculales bacterium]|nr:hypothetical protein [Thermoanaerobaculales bacterium]